MYNRIQKTIFVILTLLLLTLSGLAQAEETLRLLCAEFKPFFYTDIDGRVKGILIELGTDIISAAGYEVEYTMQSPKRISVALEQGDVDVWVGLTHLLPEVAEIGDNVVSTMNFVNCTIEPKETIKAPEDLLGKRIVILRGYTYGGWINYIKENKDQIEYYEVNSQESAVKFLEAGRADYLLSYKSAIDDLVEAKVSKGLLIQSISSFDMRIAVSKKHPRAKDLLAELEAAYIKLKSAEV